MRCSKEFNLGRNGHVATGWVATSANAVNVVTDALYAAAVGLDLPHVHDVVGRQDHHLDRHVHVEHAANVKCVMYSSDSVIMSSRIPDPSVDRRVSVNNGAARVGATTMCLDMCVMTENEKNKCVFKS